MANKLLDKREVSSFSVSVGTGLMLETLFNPTSERIDNERDIDKTNPDDYSEHYLNIRTLIRNIISSVGNAADIEMMMKQSGSAKDVNKVLVYELFNINELYGTYRCEPVLFIPDYSKIYKTVPNTYNNSNYPAKRAKLESFIDSVISKFDREDSPFNVLEGDYKIKKSTHRRLFTTHVPYDMLITTSSPNTVLLESHTGRLKTKNDMNTKYTKSAKMEMGIFPWDERILRVLGDGVMVKGLKHSIKLELYNYALKHKWTSNSSSMAVEKSMKYISGVFDKDVYPFKTLKRLF